LPDFQPIEKCWGYSKMHVAGEWHSKRGIDDTRNSLLRVWYGGPCRDKFKVIADSDKVGWYPVVTAGLCQRLIANSEKFMDVRIAEDPELEGDISNLAWEGMEQCGSDSEYESGSDYGMDFDDDA